MRQLKLASLFIAGALGLSGCVDDPTRSLTPVEDAQLTVEGTNGNVGINILLNTRVSEKILADLGTYGQVIGQIPEIDAVFLRSDASQLETIRSLSYVEFVGFDAERDVGPLDAVPVSDFSNGLSTWNLDAVDVTDLGLGNRQVPQDGSGVYVGVLDTGLLKTWRQYFPEERIAVEYATSFTGGGALNSGNVAEQPNKWEQDVNSHGTHVTSTILGYSLSGTAINGVAPNATVIPVKVLNQNGSGWSSMVAQGIMYIADLKAGPLAGSPVVINMSLGGGRLDPVEKAAIDYAIDQGVIIVASAGNNGERGMGYPGAYEPVISVAASGWTGQWTSGSWWYQGNVDEPTRADDFYIADFSSREKAGQDLDVTAPGAWVVGPYQIDSSNQTSYFYLSGTSMASPHVAGIVSLMAQADPALDAGRAEDILERTAIAMRPGSRTVLEPSGAVTYTWDSDATGEGLATADAALKAIR